MSESTNLKFLYKYLIDHKHKDLIGLKIDIKYNSTVSNSHSAPKGKPTNFMHDSDLPTSYPGFEGRIWLRYSKGLPDFQADNPVSGLIHTGTGGYGSYNGPWENLYRPYKDQDKHLYYYSYYCRLFLEDLPELQVYIAKLIMEGKERVLSKRRFPFYWIDEKTLQEDLNIRSLYEKNKKTIKIRENPYV